MTPKLVEKWRVIRDFELDDLSSSFKFTDRLARENDWAVEYAIRAVFEYKKFIFLVSISSIPLTPSDQVDQVWHLHLLYTKSYWIDLCKDILGKDIHHGPTKGSAEKQRFKDQYVKTLELYKSVFDENPPSDIWLDTEKRFREINFTRVNRNKYWVIPKLTIRR